MFTKLRLIPGLVLGMFLTSQTVWGQTGNYSAGENAGTRGTYNTFVGVGAGNNTTSSYNTFVGFSAGRYTTGGMNSFFGTWAGVRNTTGHSNAFFGYSAGYNNTTGTNNVFLGNVAGQQNTTGQRNTFIGSGAGHFNTGTSGNTLIGFQAGYRTTGIRNVYIGSQSGFSGTEAGQNVFVGTETGFRNTSGSSNTFVGDRAGYDNISGSNNSFIGHLAGRANSNGDFNSFLGSQAGSSNTTGRANTFLGAFAGNKNTTGGGNVFVGSDAGAENNTGNNNTIIGYIAGHSSTTGNDNAFLGHQSGRRNTTGSSNTYLGKDAGVNATTGSSNVLLGRGAGNRTTTGGNNVFVGRDAGNGNTSGQGNTFLGFNASMPGSQGNLSNAAAIGFRAQVTASNALVLGSINGVNGATANTNVGIGVTAPTYRLHVNGDAAKPGSSAWTVASDRRLKTGISEFADGIELLNKIRPVKYHYNGKAGMPTEQEYIGVIAQEVEEIAPYMIHRFTYADSTGATEEYLDFDATALPFIIINAIKDQQREIAAQKQLLEAKDAQLQTIMQELKSLKDALESLTHDRPAGKGNTGESAPAAGNTPANEIPTLSREKAVLEQNAPNPFSQATVIRYQIPYEFRQASITVHSLNGTTVQGYDLKGNAQGEVSLSAGSLKPGTYVYQLWVDGQAVASRKMVLVR
jgi:trimeric autotransporter adhesin